MAPIIGIVSNETIISTATVCNEAATYLFQGNITGIQQAGGRPILLPIQDPSAIPDYLSLVDGILIPGGQDINPALYQEVALPETKDTSAQRDRFETALIQDAIAQDIPLMGICRGFQLINVTLGGTLYQDPKYLPTPPKVNHDQMPAVRPEIPTETLTTTEPLTQLIGPKPKVNTLHHQFIKTLSPQLKPTAYSLDKTIEAFTAKDDDQNIVGYQWHPEIMVANEKWQGLFDDFIKHVQIVKQKQA